MFSLSKDSWPFRDKIVIVCRHAASLKYEFIKLRVGEILNFQSWVQIGKTFCKKYPEEEGLISK